MKTVKVVIEVKAEGQLLDDKFSANDVRRIVFKSVPLGRIEGSVVKIKSVRLVRK